MRKPQARVRAVAYANRFWIVGISSLLLAGFIIAVVTAQGARAQDASGDASVAVSVQLNKLEDTKNGCRVYFVIANKTPKSFETFNIDLILFRADGVIGKRLYADIAPLRAERERQVKLFDLEGVKCGDIESLHVNDTVECRNEDGAFDQCFSRLAVSSLGSVKLSK